MSSLATKPYGIMPSESAMSFSNVATISGHILSSSASPSNLARSKSVMYPGSSHSVLATLYVEPSIRIQRLGVSILCLGKRWTWVALVGAASNDLNSLNPIFVRQCYPIREYGLHVWYL